jgi:acetate kinase
MKILVLNAGSSSQKSCLYEIPEAAFPETPAEPIWEAMVDWGANPDSGRLSVAANGTHHERHLPTDAPSRGLEEVLETLVQGETQVLGSLSEIAIVGHRVVHGGDRYSQATFVTEAVKETIERLIPLAPNHNPAHLEEILAVEAVLGDIPQVAVFDTAFHTSIPAAAATYPIPYEWFDKGIRRYGFHGISHRYCAQRAAALAGKPLESLRMITAHLGNGASLAAIREGKSINTTMGFTPLEGLMMGTRSGSIDPAIPLYLLKETGLDAQGVDRLLNKESGLKGIFGPSGDLREILQAREAGNRRAALAFEMYVGRLQGAIAALIPQLGGLDLLAFTAGVGENSSAVREATCAGLTFLGLELDAARHESSGQDWQMSSPNSSVQVWVIHAQEDWAIARDCWQLAQSHRKGYSNET